MSLHQPGTRCLLELEHLRFVVSVTPPEQITSNGVVITNHGLHDTFERLLRSQVFCCHLELTPFWINANNKNGVKDKLHQSPISSGIRAKELLRAWLEVCDEDCMGCLSVCLLATCSVHPDMGNRFDILLLEDPLSPHALAHFDSRSFSLSKYYFDCLLSAIRLGKVVRKSDESVQTDFEIVPEKTFREALCQTNILSCDRATQIEQDLHGLEIKGKTNEETETEPSDNVSSNAMAKNNDDLDVEVSPEGDKVLDEQDLEKNAEINVENGADIGQNMETQKGDINNMKNMTEIEDGDIQLIDDDVNLLTGNRGPNPCPNVSESNEEASNEEQMMQDDSDVENNTLDTLDHNEQIPIKDTSIAHDVEITDSNVRVSRDEIVEEEHFEQRLKEIEAKFKEMMENMIKTLKNDVELRGNVRHEVHHSLSNGCLFLFVFFGIVFAALAALILLLIAA